MPDCNKGFLTHHPLPLCVWVAGTETEWVDLGHSIDRQQAHDSWSRSHSTPYFQELSFLPFLWNESTEDWMNLSASELGTWQKDFADYIRSFSSSSDYNSMVGKCESLVCHSRHPLFPNLTHLPWGMWCLLPLRRWTGMGMMKERTCSLWNRNSSLPTSEHFPNTLITRTI